MGSNPAQGIYSFPQKLSSVEFPVTFYIYIYIYIYNLFIFIFLFQAHWQNRVCKQPDPCIHSKENTTKVLLHTDNILDLLEILCGTLTHRHPNQPKPFRISILLSNARIFYSD